MVPKAELHVHIEGAILPSLARQLAKKNKVSLPSAIFGSGDCYLWDGFFGFIKAYDVIADLIKTPEDSTLVISEYLQQCAKEGTVYSEITISPTHYAKQGMNYQDMLGSAVVAIDHIKKETGLVARLLISAVRHEGVDVVEAVIREMIDNPHPYVVGVNLAGDEVNFPPKRFANAFLAASEAGYGCSVHAGEVVGPESVWEALDYLPVSRIGHGVRAIEDPKLIEALIRQKITLEVSPSSNVSIGVFPSYEAHPLRKLYDAGVKVTLNSDDPCFFCTTIGNEYQIARDKFGMSDDDLRKITRTAIENGFADDQTKQEIFKEVKNNRM